MSLSASKIDRLREKLRKWGDQNVRDYPWRYSDDPYEVLVAEFMLHRTQAKQAKEVYQRFMWRYPNLEELHKAEREEVRDILAPLGLNWRIEGMLDVLGSLWKQYGQVPSSKEKLIRERNVGQYIAGATAVFVEGENHPLIDTNTVRVTGRVFGLNLEGEARRRKEMIETISEICDPEDPAHFYYALIDLAHEICLPHTPDCKSCPLLEVPCEFGKEIIDSD